MSRYSHYKEWALTNSSHNFISKSPGMETGTYSILEMLFFLHIESSKSKRVTVYVGDWFPYFDSFRRAYKSTELNILRDENARSFNPYLFVCYSNYREYKIKFVDRVRDDETYSGRCKIVTSKVHQDNQLKLF